MRNFKHFEDEVKEVGLYVQREMRRLEGVHRFTFTIDVDGRIDGDIKIKFAANTDYESTVNGGHIAAVLEETMRRRGWQEANAPLMISHVTGEELGHAGDEE